jgi:hypothetical protein
MWHVAAMLPNTNDLPVQCLSKTFARMMLSRFPEFAHLNMGEEIQE